MDFMVFNWLEIAASVVVAFVVGGIWFNLPGFLSQWKAELGYDPAERGMQMGSAMVTRLLYVVVLAMVVSLLPMMGDILLVVAALLGALSSGLFEARSSRFVMITGGREAVLLISMIVVQVFV